MPHVILTSNRSREIGDALRRRCLYLFVEHPTVEKEVRILQLKAPGASEQLAREIGRFMQALRRRRLAKAPGVAESIDWAQALVRLHRSQLDAEAVAQTLGCFLKDRHDIEDLDRAESLRSWLRRRTRGPGVTMADDLVVHLARFAGALREHGVAAGIGDEIDATSALTLIDLFDRDEVRRAFLVAFKIRPRDRAAFDATFDAFWSVSRAGVRPMRRFRGAPVVPRSGADERRASAPGSRPGFRRPPAVRRRASRLHA